MSDLINLDRKILHALREGKDTGKTFRDLVSERFALNPAPPGFGASATPREFVDKFAQRIAQVAGDKHGAKGLELLGVETLHLNQRELVKRLNRLEEKDDRYWRRTENGDWVRREVPRKLAQPNQPDERNSVPVVEEDAFPQVNSKGRYRFTIASQTFTDGGLTEPLKNHGLPMPLRYGEEYELPGRLLRRLLSSGLQTETLSAVIPQKGKKNEDGKSSS